MMNHRVITARVPRVAAGDAGERPPCASEHSKMGVRLKRILRTSRGETARRWFKWREVTLIQTYKFETESHAD